MKHSENWKRKNGLVNFLNKKLLDFHQVVVRNKYKDFLFNLTLAASNTAFIILASKSDDKAEEESKAKAFKTLSILTTCVSTGSYILHNLSFLLYKYSTSKNRISEDENSFVFDNFNDNDDDSTKESYILELNELFKYQGQRVPRIYKNPWYLAPLGFNQLITIYYVFAPVLGINKLLSFYVLHYMSSVLGYVSEVALVNHFINEESQEKILSCNKAFLEYLLANNISKEEVIDKYSTYLEEEDNKIDFLLSFYSLLKLYDRYKDLPEKSLKGEDLTLQNLSLKGFLRYNEDEDESHSLLFGVGGFSTIIKDLKKKIESTKIFHEGEEIAFNILFSNTQKKLFFRKFKEIGKALSVRFLSQLSLNLILKFIFYDSQNAKILVPDREKRFEKATSGSNLTKVEVNNLNKVSLVSNIEDVFDNSKVCSVTFNQETLNSDIMRNISSLVSKEETLLSQFHRDYPISSCKDSLRWKTYFNDIKILNFSDDFHSEFNSVEKVSLYSLAPGYFQPDLNSLSFSFLAEFKNGCQINFHQAAEDVLPRIFFNNSIYINDDCSFSADSGVFVEKISNGSFGSLVSLYNGYFITEKDNKMSFNFSISDFKTSHMFDYDSSRVRFTMGEVLPLSPEDKYIMSYDLYNSTIINPKDIVIYEIIEENWPFYKKDFPYFLIKAKDFNNCSFILEKNKNLSSSIILRNKEFCETIFDFESYSFCGLKNFNLYNHSRCSFPARKEVVQILSNLDISIDDNHNFTTEVTKETPAFSDSTTGSIGSVSADLTLSASTEEITSLQTTELILSSSTKEAASLQTTELNLSTSTKETASLQTEVTKEISVFSDSTTGSMGSVSADLTLSTGTKETASFQTEVAKETSAFPDSSTTGSIGSVSAEVTLSASTKETASLQTTGLNLSMSTKEITSLQNSPKIITALPIINRKEEEVFDLEKFLRVGSDYIAPFLSGCLYWSCLRKSYNEITDLKASHTVINKKQKSQEFFICLVHAFGEQLDPLFNSNVSIFALSSSVFFSSYSEKPKKKICIYRAGSNEQNNTAISIF